MSHLPRTYLRCEETRQKPLKCPALRPAGPAGVSIIERYRRDLPGRAPDLRKSGCRQCLVWGDVVADGSKVAW